MLSKGQDRVKNTLQSRLSKGIIVSKKPTLAKGLGRAYEGYWKGLKKGLAKTL
jgi:hypothetical protein